MTKDEFERKHCNCDALRGVTCSIHADLKALLPVEKPFHEWKSEQYAKDQAAGTPRTREWYFKAYGGYCSRERSNQSKEGFNMDAHTLMLELSHQLGAKDGQNMHELLFAAVRDAIRFREEETGWLIENGRQHPHTLYRTVDQGIQVWAPDPNNAIRFARRVDAEMFCAGDSERAVEHSWAPLHGCVKAQRKADAKKSPTAEWRALDKVIDEYIHGYEFIGEDEQGREGSYTPTEADENMLRDCVAGLLAEDEFMAALANVYPIYSRFQYSSAIESFTTDVCEELFGCHVDTTGILFPERTYRCSICERGVPINGWVHAEHNEGCIIPKVREHLKKHRPACVPASTDSAGVPE